MYYIGIDNGINGGVVCTDHYDRVIFKYAGPEYIIHGQKTEYDPSEMSDILKQIQKEEIGMVALEKAQAFPGQGVVSQWSIGRGYGLWEGIIVALGLKYVLVHPKTWQKEILKDLNKADTKQASALFAQRMCPDTDWRQTEKCRKIHDGLTDAFCLSVYARRISI